MNIILTNIDKINSWKDKVLIKKIDNGTFTPNQNILIYLTQLDKIWIEIIDKHRWSNIFGKNKVTESMNNEMTSINDPE